MNWPSLTAKRVCRVVVAAALCFVVVFLVLSRFILLRICICTFLFHLIFIVASHLNAHNHILSSFHTNRLPIVCVYALPSSFDHRSLAPSHSIRSSFTFAWSLLLYFQFVDLNFTLIWRDAGQILVSLPTAPAAAAFGSMVICAVKRVFLINAQKETFVEMKNVHKNKNHDAKIGKTIHFFRSSKAARETKKTLRRAFILCMALFFSWT